MRVLVALVGVWYLWSRGYDSACAIICTLLYNEWDKCSRKIMSSMRSSTCRHDRILILSLKQEPAVEKVKCTSSCIFFTNLLISRMGKRTFRLIGISGQVVPYFLFCLCIPWAKIVRRTFYPQPDFVWLRIFFLVFTIGRTGSTFQFVASWCK